MRKRFGVLAAAIACVTLTVPAGAGAATEFGDNCLANDTIESPSIGLFEVANPANPLPTAAPAAGILTKWKMSSGIPAPFSINHVMKVVRQLGPSAVQIVGESPGSVVFGNNTFDARIPVQAGDRLGLTSANEFEVTFVCEGPPPSSLGIFAAGGTPGQTVPAAEGPGPVRIPVAALIEPDADNDGFGDETQDKCPQVATLQTACPPVVVLDSFALAKKGKVVVLIATSATTSVTVSGTATFPSSSKKRANSSAQAKLRGLTKVVSAGRITRFALNFPSRLKSTLATLGGGKAATLKLTATAPNLVGPTSIDRARLKVRGTAAKGGK